MMPRAQHLPALAIGLLFFCHAAQAQQAPSAPAATPSDEQRRAENPAVTTPAYVTEEDLARLETGLSTVRAKLKADFENGNEWKTAVGTVKTTTREYDAARRAVLAKVRATPEYAQAAAEHQQARQEYDALSSKPADEKTSERLLQQVLAARSAMGKLEAAELKNDPEVTATKGASVKAQNDLAALRKRFEETYQSSPEWITRIQQIDTARRALADDRRQQEQELAQQQQEALYQHRREQEEQAFRREMMINMTVQRVMLEQQSQVLNQWYAAEPVFVGPRVMGRCLPHRTQYTYAPTNALKFFSQ